jgi:hypothetical protein
MREIDMREGRDNVRKNRGGTEQQTIKKTNIR